MAAPWKTACVPASLIAVLGALAVALSGAPQASADNGGGGACIAGPAFIGGTGVYINGTNTAAVADLNAKAAGCTAVRVDTAVRDALPHDGYDALLIIRILTKDGRVLETFKFYEKVGARRTVQFMTRAYNDVPARIERTIARASGDNVYGYRVHGDDLRGN